MHIWLIERISFVANIPKGTSGCLHVNSLSTVNDCRQTIDSYSLSATPTVGFLRRPSGSIYSMYEPGIDSNIDDNIKSKLLIECSKVYSKEDVDRISRKISTWSGRGSLPDQLLGELPITFGCSVTQTVFNCKKHNIFLNFNPKLKI